MEKLKYVLTLSIICFITASLLTGVYLLTKPKILEQKAEEEKTALRDVFPSAESFEPVIKEGKTLFFNVYQEEKIAGFAFRAEAQGYSGPIETMAGMDLQGRITGIRILEQKETPGLGAKISEVLVTKTLWQAIKEFFSPKDEEIPPAAEPWFCAQFKDKEIAELVVVTKPTERNIHAVTGATISSQAVTDSVREKAKEILEYEK
jgi:electron transport complex protein RnfG